MYAKETFEIDDEINTTQLFDKLKYIGRDLLLKVLPDLLNNSLVGEEQDESKATFSFNIKREEEKIDFSKTVNEVHNLIRGLAEVPGAFCIYKEKEMKVYKSKVHSYSNDDKKVGTIKIENKNRMLVKCSNGYLELLEIKVEGKQRMDVKSFLNGINKDDLLKETLS
jgi:methionyl-tRNA formyltransferase